MVSREIPTYYIVGRSGTYFPIVTLCFAVCVARSCLSLRQFHRVCWSQLLATTRHRSTIDSTVRTKIGGGVSVVTDSFHIEPTFTFMSLESNGPYQCRVDELPLGP